MKRRPVTMTSSLGGQMLVPLEKITEEIAASALPLREWASMRANDPRSEVERSIQCRRTSIGFESYGELAHHT
jgi:hypothetical protein